MGDRRTEYDATGAELATETETLPGVVTLLSM
jgi:hypothetical protein